MSYGTDSFPRRNRIHLLTPVEKQLYDVLQAVEGVGADPLLTEAVCLIQSAREKLAEYIERSPLDVPAQNQNIATRIEALLPVDREARILTNGKKEEDMPFYQDKRPDGQQMAYVVLTEEERRKGFVRPVRNAYVHVGQPGPKFPLRDLTPEEHARWGSEGYVKFEDYPMNYKGSSSGRFWRREQLDNVGKGCKTRTAMGQSLAETYARDPSFYDRTFCCGCRTHLPIEEFVWDGTNERVGS